MSCDHTHRVGCKPKINCEKTKATCTYLSFLLQTLAAYLFIFFFLFLTFAFSTPEVPYAFEEPTILFNYLTTDLASRLLCRLHNIVPYIPSVQDVVQERLLVESLAF